MAKKIWDNPSRSAFQSVYIILIDGVYAGSINCFGSPTSEGYQVKSGFFITPALGELIKHGFMGNNYNPCNLNGDIYKCSGGGYDIMGATWEKWANDINPNIIFHSVNSPNTQGLEQFIYTAVGGNYYFGRSQGSYKKIGFNGTLNDGVIVDDIEAHRFRPVEIKQVTI